MDINNIDPVATHQRLKKKEENKEIAKKFISEVLRVAKQLRNKTTDVDEVIEQLGIEDAKNIMQILRKVPTVEESKKDKSEKAEPIGFASWWRRVRNSIDKYRGRVKSDRDFIMADPNNPNYDVPPGGFKAKLVDLDEGDVEIDPLRFYQKTMATITQAPNEEILRTTLNGVKVKFTEMEVIRADQNRKLLYVHAYKGATGLILKEWFQQQEIPFEKLFDGNTEEGKQWRNILGSRAAVYNDINFFRFYVDYPQIVYSDTTITEFFQYFATLKKYLELNPEERDYLRGGAEVGEDAFDYFFNTRRHAMEMDKEKKRKIDEAIDWKIVKKHKPEPQPAPVKANPAAELDEREKRLQAAEARLKKQEEELAKRADDELATKMQQLEIQKYTLPDIAAFQKTVMTASMPLDELEKYVVHTKPLIVNQINSFREANQRYNFWKDWPLDRFLKVYNLIANDLNPENKNAMTSRKDNLEKKQH